MRIEVAHVEDIAVETAASLEVSIEDFGIGSYEFWGAKGTDVSLGAVCDETSVEVLLPEDTEEIPVISRASRSVGGCDGDHEGRCIRACRFSAEFTITLRLDSVKKEGARYLATYAIELE